MQPGSRITKREAHRHLLTGESCAASNLRVTTHTARQKAPGKFPQHATHCLIPCCDLYDCNCGLLGLKTILTATLKQTDRTPFERQESGNSEGPLTPATPLTVPTRTHHPSSIGVPRGPQHPHHASESRTAWVAYRFPAQRNGGLDPFPDVHRFMT